jgi:hypothetical protein
MSDIPTSVATAIGQILATFGAVCTLGIRRSAALGEILSTVGKVKRVALVSTLTKRIRLLYCLESLRLCLFSLFLICFFACLRSVILTLPFLNSFSPEAALDPGLGALLINRLTKLASNSLLLGFVAAILIFLDWIVEALCHYKDLERCLSILEISDRVELAESTYFLQDKHADIMLLWQVRIRYCVETEQRNDLKGVLRKLGNANLTWTEFSTAVCGYRMISAKTGFSSPK